MMQTISNCYMLLIKGRKKERERDHMCHYNNYVKKPRSSSDFIYVKVNTNVEVYVQKQDFVDVRVSKEMH